MSISGYLQGRVWTDRRASGRKTMVSGPLFELHKYFLFKIFNYGRHTHTHTD